MAKKETKTLHILHHSAEWKDDMAETVKDLDLCFSKDPDIITFTEMRPGDPRRTRMAEFARARGYRALLGPGDTQLAVRVKEEGIRVKGKGSMPVHGGVPQEAPGQGFYGPKYLNWGHIGFHGQDIYISSSHWATRAQEGGVYREHFNKMAKAVVNKMLDHSKKGIAFWAGDINADPDEGKFPHELFRKNRVKTCWDDANAEPATRFQRNIDVIARYGGEKRVEFKRYKIWHGQESDHRPFSAWYEIDVSTKNNQGGNNNGGNGGGTQPDENFLTGGLRSFRDYKDVTLYDLPQAVDDSDLFNG